MTERPRLWLTVVAAVTAAIFLYQSVGRDALLLLLVGYGIGYAVYRIWRAKKAANNGVRCLTCGETLAPTARSCQNCGSAKWTVIN